MSDQDDKPDIEIDVTNGKTIKVNLNTKEWIVIMIGLTCVGSTFSWLAGVI